MALTTHWCLHLCLGTQVYQGQYQGPSCPDEPENTGYTGCLPTALTEIAAANGGGQVSFVNGCAGGQDCNGLVNQSLVKAVVDAADVVLLVLGEKIGVTNEEGNDRSSYALPGKQTQLAQLVGNMSKPVVVIMLTGGAVGMDWIASQKAWSIMIPGYSGIFGPRAIARTLFGEAAPSGLLPYTVRFYRFLPLLHLRLHLNDLSALLTHLFSVPSHRQVYPDSWDANCYDKGTTCGNDLHNMDLQGGDGRTYRWYGYRNATLQATIPFGSGVYYTEFSAVVKSNEAAPSSDEAAGSAQVQAGMYDVTITNTGKLASRCRVVVFVRPITIDKSAPRPLPIKTIADFGA